MRMRVEPCLMMEKIEWYQEVLKLDPDSKVFFPAGETPEGLAAAGQGHRGFAGGATAFVCFS